jgi:hypothetical protein
VAQTFGIKPEQEKTPQKKAKGTAPKKDNDPLLEQ